jgi:biotin-dependent carboxylase-like uncharacterized protein
VLVERPGLQSIVVDAGRLGLRDRGVAWCGPMDAGAYASANALLGNDERAAALEIVLGDMHVTFSAAARCALAGADCDAQLDGRAIESWAAFDAAAGSRLRLGRPRAGMRTVLAFDGGIDVPAVLGSRTTDLIARFGGFGGRALRTGDVVRLAASHSDSPRAARAPVWDARVRVVLESAFEELCARPWTIGHESNRMAWRLRGAPIMHRPPSIASRAVFPGMVQVPPSGEPIVLAADAQTTGGYPIAGIVLEDDLWKLAQAPLGASVQFVRA